MDEVMREKCREYFKRCKKAEVVYVAGGKLFTSEGAAQSYATTCESVKRADVMKPVSAKTDKTEE